MRFLKWLVPIFVFLALTPLLPPQWGGPTQVAANGAPVKVFLSYLPEFSNYGPAEASGVALVSIGEAWVDLTADGLPRLSGEQYEAWLIKAETEEMVSLGKFNADADGHVAYYAELDELPVVDYRYFLISVEPEPDTAPVASSRWTIAGVFPNPELHIANGTPTPTLAPGTTPTPQAPSVLPVTGRPFPAWGLAGALVIVGLALIAGVLLLSLRIKL
jgi:hypothetical protein